MMQAAILRHVILVVDDDPFQRMHASDLLGDAGYVVVEAGNTEEALKALLARDDIRLVFTDVQMPPGPDGIALARKIERHWPCIHLLITSGGVELGESELPNKGRFVRKPYVDQKVLRHVADLIASSVSSVDGNRAKRGYYT